MTLICELFMGKSVNIKYELKSTQSEGAFFMPIFKGVRTLV